MPRLKESFSEFVPLIGPARPFNSSWRLLEHLCSMSLRMFDSFLAHWPPRVLLCIHTLCQVSGVHYYDKNADVPHLHACALLHACLYKWMEMQELVKYVSGIALATSVTHGTYLNWKAYASVLSVHQLSVIHYIYLICTYTQVCLCTGPILL